MQHFCNDGHLYNPQKQIYHITTISISFITKLEVQGPSGPRLLAGGPSGLLTSSFAPFGRSGRVTHADVSMMHVSMKHVSMMHVSMKHVSMMHLSMMHVSLMNVSMMHVSIMRQILFWTDQPTNKAILGVGCWGQWATPKPLNIPTSTAKFKQKQRLCIHWKENQHSQRVFQLCIASSPRVLERRF